MIERLKKELKKAGSPARAKASMWFFKTEKGSYGHGDVFLGVNMPVLRIIAKRYMVLSLKDIQTLLLSPIHEHRLTALVILVDKYNKADEASKNKIFEFYLANAQRINNWDLVDLSAPYIPGVHLRDKNKKALYKLAKSENLWEKRIAIISTFGFIRNGQFTDTLKVAKILLNDKHDLIHKAVGWMLREVGKRSLSAEELFLKKYRKHMPRTALRYAIEKFSEEKRKFYLSKVAKTPFKD
ncbi:MAG TPA: DNA alkylation repair protein [Patescibacteria group bacterium]